MNDVETWQAIADALMRYDRKQMKRKGYNPNALAAYIKRLEEVARDVDNGLTWRKALEWGFCDRVLACALKAIGCRASARAETGTADEIKESVKRA